jgi:hypothetical protein
MLRRNLWLCGVCLAVLGLMQMAGTSGPGLGATPVSSTEAGQVSGGAYCATGWFIDGNGCGSGSCIASASPVFGSIGQGSNSAYHSENCTGGASCGRVYVLTCN